MILTIIRMAENRKNIKKLKKKKILNGNLIKPIKSFKDKFDISHSEYRHFILNK